MIALLAVLLFATAFAASLWTLYISIKPQLHRYRALFAPAATAELALRPSRITIRWSAPVRSPARVSLRAAA
jgi:hypothetical protein